uniref:Nematicidal protein n=1 Tax=Xenorhabdus bovienii TaxID=40576 RepID=Q9EVR8_XENBV|nr:nematicidal protein [Xenorhabdus bovienii]
MSDWTGVSTFNVILETGLDNCNIYANGLNMIGVIINITPTDDEGNFVDIDDVTLNDNIKIVDYIDGSDIDGSDGWFYTGNPNEYNTIPNSQSYSLLKSENSQITQIKRYVSCSNTSRLRTKSFSAKVTTTSGKVISITQNSINSSRVVINAIDATNFTDDELRTTKETRFENQSYTSHKSSTNSLYVHTWTIPRSLKLQNWRWEDYNNGWTWAQSCYYKTGADGGSESTRWLAAGSIFPPGNYDGLWLDNDIALSGMAHKSYNVDTGINQLSFTRIIGKGFSWVYNISGLDRGHAVIIIDQYGNKYRILFHAGYENSDPYLSSSIVY